MSGGSQSGKWSSHFFFFAVLLLVAGTTIVGACSEQQEHIAPAVRDEDSVAMMVTRGVNMLISDSGVIKYKIVAEESSTNQNVTPARTTFNKGVFMTQFDEDLHVQAYVLADTGYKYDEIGLIELRGRVRMLTKTGTRFAGEELFWDQRRHEYYSTMFSHLETPERTLEGDNFRSNEEMTRYYVSMSSGAFAQRDIVGEEERNDSDSLALPVRPQASPHRRQP